MYNFPFKKTGEKILNKISPSREEKVSFVAKSIAAEITEDLINGEKMSSKEVNDCLTEIRQIVKTQLQEKLLKLEIEVQETVNAINNN